LESNVNDCRNEANKPINTYVDAALKKYRVCDGSCYSCVDTSNKCTKCTNDYFILEDKINTCIIKNLDLNYFDTAANQGYFLDIINSKYFLCDVSCVTCVNNKDKCLQCKTASNYFPLVDNINSCKNMALVGYYLNATTKIYEFCDKSCRTCVDSPANCTECKTADKYFKLDDQPNTCKNAPPDGYYFENAVQFYKRCDVSCFTCIDNPNKCTKCNTNYFFLEDVANKCMNYALPNYYLDVAFSSYRRCAISCELCIDRADKCTRCNYKNIYFPLVNDNFSCFNECPDYYWKNFLKKECSSCHISCKKCADDMPICKVNSIFENILQQNFKEKLNLQQS